MAKYQLTKRLEIIVHLLDNYPFLSKDSILSRLEADYDLPTATRTLERDFQKLGTDFGIGVAYDRNRNGYYLEAEDKARVASFLKFAGLVHLGELFKEGLADFNALQDAVALEDHSRFKGIELIRPLLLAIKQQQVACFRHENYINNTQKNYAISPLQIREYNNRWYIVGIPTDEDHIKTFGIDRISNLQLKEPMALNRKGYQRQLKKFEEVIGLNYDASESPEPIEIRVTPQQYKYLESLPLHSSQRKLAIREGNWITLRFFLIVNYEFKMQLLKLGDQIEVVSPQRLREELMATLEQTLKLYKNGKTQHRKTD